MGPRPARGTWSVLCELTDEASPGLQFTRHQGGRPPAARPEGSASHPPPARPEGASYFTSSSGATRGSTAPGLSFSVATRIWEAGGKDTGPWVGLASWVTWGNLAWVSAFSSLKWVYSHTHAGELNGGMSRAQHGGCWHRADAPKAVLLQGTQRAVLPHPQGPGLPGIPTDRLQEGPSRGQFGNLCVQPSVPQPAE